MTTASSLTFPMMEVPAAEDTMEMASPLPGNADDFEIDLDVTEDQASNADKDMMGAEDYPDGSLDIDFNQDGANDADMMDDVAEPTMVDADDQYPETNENVEMQYSAEETYEAEMEDEYDEDIDVPMPKPDGEAPAAVEDGDVQPPEVTVEKPIQTIDTAEKDNEKPSQEPRAEPEKEHVAEHVEVSHTEPAQDEHPGVENVPQRTDLDRGRLHETNQAERAELRNEELDISKNEHTDVKPEDEDRETTEGQPSVHEAKEKDTELAGKLETVESPEQGQGPDMDKHAGLHPVKVYYQDNEISLFPPREGDSSETYFLEDESLAYEDFGKLFESCHEVLREHIGDNEFLVVDIDALNIQLTEDSLHLSKVTLHHVVDLYLRLCQNDNIDEPEPLYLTLSTRLTVPAAVSDLLAAANEGKGLSEVYSWDDYEEAGPLSEEARAEDQYVWELHEEERQEPQKHEGPVDNEAPVVDEKHEAPVPAEPAEAKEPQAPEEHKKPEPSEKPQQDEAPEAREYPQQETAEREDGQQDISDQTELGVHVHGIHHEQQEDQENENDEKAAANDRDEDSAPTAKVDQDGYEEGEYEEGEYELEVQENNELDSENQAHDRQSPNDKSYDSEEQKTESTATLAALPGTSLEDEQQYADESADVPRAEHGDQNEYREIDGIGEEDYSEEAANLDASDRVEYSEDFEDNGGKDAYDVAKPELNANESHDEHSSEAPEPDHGDGTGQGLTSKGEVADEPLQGEPEDVLHGEPEGGDLTQDEPQDTPESVDDLLGIQDDLTENTAKNATDANGEIGDEDRGDTASGEVLNETEHAPSANTGEGHVEDLTFDGDDDYLNLDFDDEPGQPGSTFSDAVAHDHVSTKRPREPEDDFELIETPTPDVKRTRSS